MTTFGTMRDRIADELDRADLTSQIEREIRSAVAFYEKKRFWFNEQRIDFPTVASQEWYTSSDDSAIPNLLTLDIAKIAIGATNKYELELAPYAELEFASDGGEADEGQRLERALADLALLLDALGLDKVHVVGNSFGGSMALALAIAHPERVDRLVLMGAVGVPFEITPGLDAVWGYQPSLDAMGRLMRETFAYDASLVTDELVRMRYAASTRPGVQEAFAAMFPAPRQRWAAFRADAAAPPAGHGRRRAHRLARTAAAC